MQQLISEIIFYLKGTLKYKWVAVSLAWVLCLSGWLFVLAMPDKYTSVAKVHVETRTMLQPLLKGMTIQSDVRGLLRVMQLLMFTKNNLEQIIKLSEMDKNIKNPIDQAALIENLKKDIHINGGADDIFTITYEAKDPDTAKGVVQAVLTVFSEQTQLSTLGGIDVAHHFIDEQIQEYEARLRNGEKARENFKRANLGLLPGQGSDQISQIQEMTNALEEAKLGLKEALSRKDALNEQLEEALVAEDDEWGEETGVEATPDDAQIAELKKRKDELLIKYTPNHPEVVHIEKTIKEIEKSNAEKQANKEEKGGLDTAVMTNPYVQSIKVAINEADANIASINSRVEIFQKRLEKAQEELNMRFSIETEMENLNRDYAAIKKNYDQLLASREQASMSKKVDDQAEALKFKIADAPNTPLQPSSPNRKLLFSGVLIMGIVFGLGVAFLLYMIRPTIMSISQLRQITGLPVLGGISMKKDAIQIEKNKKEMIRYSVATLGLVVIYIGFMTVEILELKIFSLSNFLQKIN
ncbi:MAG: XrtA system polysaccharide chain length determinant [Methylococcaceae bacterium]